MLNYSHIASLSAERNEKSYSEHSSSGVRNLQHLQPQYNHQSQTSDNLNDSSELLRRLGDQRTIDKTICKNSQANFSLFEQNLNKLSDDGRPSYLSINNDLSHPFGSPLESVKSVLPVDLASSTPTSAFNYAPNNGYMGSPMLMSPEYSVYKASLSLQFVGSPPPPPPPQPQHQQQSHVPYLADVQRYKPNPEVPYFYQVPRFQNIYQDPTGFNAHRNSQSDAGVLQPANTNEYHRSFMGKRTSSGDSSLARRKSTSQSQFNYRIILNQDSDYDWNEIVSRIVNDNEQQASIFLQQKLKIANPIIKQKIYDAMSFKALALMVNRFGNFLIQRALENGNEEQITQITNNVVCNVVQLATDPYGCHVIQKALDFTGSAFKRLITEEMLSDIDNTITQRYACHIWQKLIETNWDDQGNQRPIDIIPILNKELHGQWKNLSLNAFGSLVVQTILENCSNNSMSTEIGCVEEIILNLKELICGQWGNWVVQHLLEYGQELHKQQVINHILDHATEYSMDQYGASVIEKMFKTGNESFIIQNYLDRVCVKAPGKTRVALVDIAANIHGSFLVQYIFKKGLTQHRQQVVQQLKRHMVFLRSSKWGCRCVWLMSETGVEG